MNKSEVLNLIAEMRAKAQSPRERQFYDGMAIGLITQDIEPLTMAENLNHWLELTKTLTPLRAAN